MYNISRLLYEYHKGKKKFSKSSISSIKVLELIIQRRKTFSVDVLLSNLLIEDKIRKSGDYDEKSFLFNQPMWNSLTLLLSGTLASAMLVDILIELKHSIA